MHRLLKQLVIEYQAKAEGYRIDLAIPQGTFPATLNMDESKFRIIMNHLIANAIKFSEKNGIIKIRGKLTAPAEYFDAQAPHTRRDTLGSDGMLEICVSDTGIGVKKEHLEEIFTPFKCFQTDTRKLNEGIGLGLAIAKKFVETMGGTIRAESSGIGRGTAIRLTIPVEAQ